MKKYFVSSLFVMFAFALLSFPCFQALAEIDPAVKQADDLFKQERYEASIEELKKVGKNNPDHPDVYWMIARNYFFMGENIPIEKDKNKKLNMYRLCEEWAKKGYEKNPGLADNAFFLAAGFSKQAETMGIASTLINDRKMPAKIEKYLLEALAAKEFHDISERSDTIAGAHMALGVFYRKIPDSAVVKLLTGTKGDMDKSVDHCRKALERFPRNIELNKELGVSLLCRGQRQDEPEDITEGKTYLEKALELAAETKLDRIDQADAKKLIDAPSLACGYSRVQQEEVSDADIK